MKAFKSIGIIGLIVFTLFLGNVANAQNYSLAKDTAITITVTGTSTLHGWTVVVKEVKKVPTNLDLSGDEIQSITNFSFEVVVNSMDGGRGASMNSKIQNALQASNHPVISFQQSEPAMLTELEENGNFKLLSRGLLNMIGQEKTIEIEVSGQKTANGIILKGSKPLKFSDFEIEPPSAMFGQIVCGDDIAVNFEFRYEEE